MILVGIGVQGKFRSLERDFRIDRARQADDRRGCCHIIQEVGKKISKQIEQGSQDFLDAVTRRVRTKVSSNSSSPSYFPQNCLAFAVVYCK